MKKMLFTLTCTVLITVACGTSSTPPTFNPNIIQTAVIGTAFAAQNQTQTAIVPIDTPIPTNTPILTETPLSPLSLVYEGLTTSCVCNFCGCITNIIFTARVTIDPQGYVTGVLDKYHTGAPAIEFEGTKANFHGLFQDDNDKFELIGSISNNLTTLDATLSFEGINEAGDGLYAGMSYSGKRTMVLFKK
jgi:hypothetical protein